MARDEPLVTIATFETELEASFARGALEAIGISALVACTGQSSRSLNRTATAHSSNCAA